jgi:hypothetical protein
MLVGVKIAKRSIHFQERIRAPKSANFKNEWKRWTEMRGSSKRQAIGCKPIKTATNARSSRARGNSKPIIPTEGSLQGNLGEERSRRHECAVCLCGVEACLGDEVVLGSRPCKIGPRLKAIYQPILKVEPCENALLWTSCEVLGYPGLGYTLSSSGYSCK